MQLPISQFTFTGDLELYPRKADALTSAILANLRLSSRDTILSAHPFIDTDRELGRLWMDCKVDDEKLSLQLIDVGSDSPGLINKPFGIELTQVMEQFPTYFSSRVSPTDLNRSTMHKSLADSLVKNFEAQGISFENRGCAVQGFHDLTAYWFYLLETRHGKGHLLVFGGRPALDGAWNQPA